MGEHINNPVPVVAIVVAAGSGSRLGAEVPKALVPVGGVPLLTRAGAPLAAGGPAAAGAGRDSVVPAADRMTMSPGVCATRTTPWPPSST